MMRSLLRERRLDLIAAGVVSALASGLMVVSASGSASEQARVEQHVREVVASLGEGAGADTVTSASDAASSWAAFFDAGPAAWESWSRSASADRLAETATRVLDRYGGPGEAKHAVVDPLERAWAALSTPATIKPALDHRAFERGMVDGVMESPANEPVEDPYASARLTDPAGWLKAQPQERRDARRPSSFRREGLVDWQAWGGAAVAQVQAPQAGSFNFGAANANPNVYARTAVSPGAVPFPALTVTPPPALSARLVPVGLLPSERRFDVSQRALLPSELRGNLYGTGITNTSPVSPLPANVAYGQFGTGYAAPANPVGAMGARFGQGYPVTPSGVPRLTPGAVPLSPGIVPAVPSGYPAGPVNTYVAPQPPTGYGQVNYGY